MAGSRLEKFGTIYKRVQGLLRSGAMKPADRPMWCEVYEAFPPRDPPEYQRPVPAREVPQILYPEDIVRVQFYKTYGNPDVVDLTNERVKTTCQRFVDKYLELLQSDPAGRDLFEATAHALKEEGLRLRTVAELQDPSSAPMEKHSRTSTSAQEPRLSVASIFGENTATQAQSGVDNDDDVDIDDVTEKDPKFSR